MIQDNYKKFISLRERFVDFIYESFEYHIAPNGFVMQFNFLCKDIESNEIIEFHPKQTILKKDFLDFKLKKDNLDVLVFNIGMIELISYWKFACAKNIIIKPYKLQKEQIEFFSTLYYNGLGEFRYLNGLNVPMNEFFTISSQGETEIHSSDLTLEDKYLVPIGGGKDSVVSLELLRGKGKDILPLVINQRGATRDCIKQAGYSDYETLEVERKIDERLLQLNKEGYLNGHTPFSSLLAFTTLLCAAFSKRKYIALSNEDSANEATVKNTNINHQWSKSLEFENAFRKYYKQYICKDIEYFSLLRPINELHIAKIFSYLDYQNVFKSCNVGSKQDIWCGKCAKCLFAYIILSPYIEPEKLEAIFGKNLFADESLKEYLQELDGEKPVKPFECVGTTFEVNAALALRCKRYKVSEQDKLLKYWLQSPISKDFVNKDFDDYISKENQENNLPEDLKDIFAKAYIIVKKAKFSRLIRRENIAIMGFAREGQSTYKLITSLLKDKTLVIYDANQDMLLSNKLLKNSKHILLYDEEALQYIEDNCSMVFLTPAISIKDIPQINYKKITNQCDIFLRLFSLQTIGISGTKGKSTTTSLTYSMLSKQHQDTLLVGNIGIPFIDILDNINEKSIIIAELSCHQLQHIKLAPKISVLLNLYQEHLDHYSSFEEYQLSKLNLLSKGKTDYTFIYNKDDERITNWLQRFNEDRIYKPFALNMYHFKEPILKGDHNKLNILAAMLAVESTGIAIDKEQMINDAVNFKALEHRLEFVRQVDGVDYYNDSISTIPQATLAALDSLKNVSTLILGGMDRGIDYSDIEQVVSKYKVQNIVFVGSAGRRMYDIIASKHHLNFLISNNWQEIIKFCHQYAKKNTSVLLSPAAASYDQFKNFEHRGITFKTLVEELTTES